MEYLKPEDACVKPGVENFGAELVTLGMCRAIVHLTREVKWPVSEHL